jgi:hypothetical protein
LGTEQFLNSLNTDETFVSSRIGALGIEDGGCNDGSEIGHVHSRSSLFVTVRERSDPFEKDEEDFGSVSIDPWKENDKEVETALALLGVFQSYSSAYATD